MAKTFYWDAFFFFFFFGVWHSPNVLGRDLISKWKELIHFASNEDFALEFFDQLELYLLCSLQFVPDLEHEFQ